MQLEHREAGVADDHRVREGMTTDVSAVGDPNTGVAVYNARTAGTVVGGTSAASPLVAGDLRADQHTAADDRQFVYKNATAFYDVTSGTNGSCGTILCNAGAAGTARRASARRTARALGGGSACTPACAARRAATAAAAAPAARATPASRAAAASARAAAAEAAAAVAAAVAPARTRSARRAPRSHGSCDTCAGDICARDSYCCTTAWDNICVGEVSLDLRPVVRRRRLDVRPLDLRLGQQAVKTCDACAGNICGQDPYCCNTKWDSQCVSEVSSICGETCN